jgi:hypothetical protein
MQRFNLAIRKSQNVEWPPDYVNHRGEGQTLRRIFQQLDIDLSVNHEPNEVGERAWRLSHDLIDLYDLLPRRRTIAQGNSDWFATALIVPSIAYVSGNRVRNPQGVMFDVGSGRDGFPPRQGCALAWRTLRDDPRIYLRTLAHEVGHVLNLVHPEEESPAEYHGRTLMFETRTLSRSRTFPENICGLDPTRTEALRSSRWRTIRQPARPTRWAARSTFRQWARQTVLETTTTHRIAPVLQYAERFVVGADRIRNTARRLTSGLSTDCR